MYKLKCAVIDDEPHALELVKGYVEDTPFLELVGESQSAQNAMALVNDVPIDLLFLDVQMPGLSGMTFARTLEKEIKIIFTTAFEQYALEGYKVNAVDYLLKPFSYEEFLMAAHKAKKIIALEQQKQSVNVTNDYILIKADYKIWQIPLDDILYIEGIKDYVRIHRRSTSKLLMPLMSMKMLDQRLPSDRFMRVHRSYIVNLNSIEVIERNQVVFDNTRITVSENYKSRFQAFIKARFMG